MTRRKSFLIATLATVLLFPTLAHAQTDDPPPFDDTDVIRTFFLENAEVKDVMTMVRSLLGIKHVAAAEDVDAILIRDTVENVDLAAAIIRTQDRPRNEVVVHVELIEIDLPTIPDVAPEGMPGRLSRDEHARLMSSSGVRVLARPSLSAVAGKKAELMIGDRVPIPTTSFNTANAAGGNIVPVTSFQYQEVGLKLVIWPRVHAGAGEVTLDFQMEMSHNSEKAGGPEHPVIETRQIVSSARLGDGESYLLTGLAGPGSAAKEREGREIGLVLTPYVVRRLDAGEESTTLAVGR